MAIRDYISEIQTSDGNTHLIGSSVWVSAEEWNGKTITEVETEIKTKFDAKQDSLVSGTNIKTINGESVLGSGDITISTLYTSDVNDDFNEDFAI